MVNSPKVPVAVHNRRLVFSLQQADRLCKILQSDDRLDSKLADEIAGSIYISIQRLMCSTRGTSDASQAARAIYERVQAIKADIQTFQLRRIDTVAFNSFINTLYVSSAVPRIPAPSLTHLSTERSDGFRSGYQTNKKSPPNIAGNRAKSYHTASLPQSDPSFQLRYP
jgi:hypothetical protein